MGSIMEGFVDRLLISFLLILSMTAAFVTNSSRNRVAAVLSFTPSPIKPSSSHPNYPTEQIPYQDSNRHNNLTLSPTFTATTSPKNESWSVPETLHSLPPVSPSRSVVPPPPPPPLSAARVGSPPGSPPGSPLPPHLPNSPQSPGSGSDGSSSTSLLRRTSKLKDKTKAFMEDFSSKPYLIKWSQEQLSGSQVLVAPTTSSGKVNILPHNVSFSDDPYVYDSPRVSIPADHAKAKTTASTASASNAKESKYDLTNPSSEAEKVLQRINDPKGGSSSQLTGTEPQQEQHQQLHHETLLQEDADDRARRKLMVLRDKRLHDTSRKKKHSIYIAGFFPMSFNISEGSVGRGVLPAVNLALYHINESPEILDDYVLHITWNNTKCSAAEGMKSFFDTMYQAPRKVMLFGDACTTVTDPIAKASKHWKVAQLSYADMHPQFSKKNYPNLFRIVPSENEFNAPRIQLLKQFNWTRVGTLYQNDPRYSLAHNRLVSDLEANGLKVEASQSFADDITYQLSILKEKDIRIILGNFNETWARRIFCEAHRQNLYGRKYQWLIVGTYARQWWRKNDVNCSLTEIETALKGAILVDLLPLSTSEEITVSGRTAGDYKEMYEVVAQGEYSRFHGYAYDGIWAIALALHNISYSGKGPGGRTRKGSEILSNFRYRDGNWEKTFLTALEATRFTGVTGFVQFRDNGRKGSVLIKQFQAFNTVNAEVKVGEYDGVSETLSLIKGRNITWNGKSPPKDRTFNLEVHTRVNITLFAAMSTVSSVGILIAGFFLAVNIRFRNQRYIKMSSPYLNNLIIIGCILTYTSIIVLGLDSHLTSESAFPYICTARAWILMAGFTLAFGSMFSKTWRVHSIFTNVKLNKKVIKDMQLFIVVGILLGIDFAIMTTWHFVDPFYRETKKMEGYMDATNEDVKIIPVNEYCRSNHMNIFMGCIYAYKGLLLIFGCFLAWETRHVSIPALNDSKYIGMSVYNSVMMCLIGAPLSHVLSDKQDASFVIISIFILFCTTATLCLVFLPKLIELKRNPNGTIEKRLRTTIKPPFSTRRSSATSLYETELKSAKQQNQRYRKQIREIDSEIQALAKLVGGEEAQEILHEVMHNLSLPKSEVLKKEDTDVSSLYSFNSDGEDVFIESPEKKSALAEKFLSAGHPAPWQAVTAGVLNSAKTILFAPELGAVLSPPEATHPDKVSANGSVTSPSEEPTTVEEKSLPKILEERLEQAAPRPPYQHRGSAPPPPSETLLDLYNQICATACFQPIAYPLHTRLNKSEHDIMRVVTKNGSNGLDRNHLTARSKKSSASESHLTVIMSDKKYVTPQGDSSITTQEELWGTINKDRRYISRNSGANEVIVTPAELQRLRRSSNVETTSNFTISIPSPFGEGTQKPPGASSPDKSWQKRKYSVPVLPLAVRRQQSRESRLQKLQSPPKSTVNTIESFAEVERSPSPVKKPSIAPKPLKSPTAISTKPGVFQLKTDHEDNSEIMFASESDLPNFSSSMSHIDRHPNQLDGRHHHSSSMRLIGKRSGCNNHSSEDIPQGSVGHLYSGSTAHLASTTNPTLSKYRSYSVPKRLDNSVLNFSEINLDVSLLPIFHKLLSERRSLRDNHHRRHLSQRPMERARKTDKEKFMVSCPNIMIKCDIVEYL